MNASYLFLQKIQNTKSSLFHCLAILSMTNSSWYPMKNSASATWAHFLASFICHLWKETNLPLHHDLISSSYQPPPDKTAPSAASHSLVFESFHQFCWRSLHVVKQHSILLVVRCSQLNTALKIHSHQGWIERDDHLLSSANCTTSDTNRIELAFLAI